MAHQIGRARLRAINARALDEQINLAVTLEHGRTHARMGDLQRAAPRPQGADQRLEATAPGLQRRARRDGTTTASGTRRPVTALMTSISSGQRLNVPSRSRSARPRPPDRAQRGPPWPTRRDPRHRRQARGPAHPTPPQRTRHARCQRRRALEPVRFLCGAKDCGRNRRHIPLRSMCWGPARSGRHDHS
jgi:hypothetical protein